MTEHPPHHNKICVYVRGEDNLRKEIVNIQAEIRENLDFTCLENKIVSISQVLYAINPKLKKTKNKKTTSGKDQI